MVSVQRGGPREVLSFLLFLGGRFYRYLINKSGSLFELSQDQ